jgi:hypothetical protein
MVARLIDSDTTEDDPESASQRLHRSSALLFGAIRYDSDTTQRVHRYD